MVELLSVQDMADFMSAMDDLKDTFHKDTVAFIQSAENYSLMDNQAPSAPTTHLLDCRVTKLDDRASQTQNTVDGNRNEHDIEIRFFARYLRANQMMVQNKPVFETEKDFFTWEGDRYLLKLVSFDDSDMANDVVLVVCHCDKMLNVA